MQVNFLVIPLILFFLHTWKVAAALNWWLLLGWKLKAGKRKEPGRGFRSRNDVFSKGCQISSTQGLEIMMVSGYERLLWLDQFKKLESFDSPLTFDSFVSLLSLLMLLMLSLAFTASMDGRGISSTQMVSFLNKYSHWTISWLKASAVE